MMKNSKHLTVFLSVMLAVMLLSTAAYAAAADVFGVEVTVNVTGYNTGHEVTVSLCQNDEVKHTSFVTMYEGGGRTTRTVDVRNVTPGTYDIVIESEGCVISTIKNVTVDRAIDLSLYNNTALNNISLINGDIDGDGFIDSTDVSCFVFDISKGAADASYPNSDINGDTFRDALDVSILSHNLFASDPKIQFVSELPEYASFSSDIVESVATKSGTPVTVTVSANAITIDSAETQMVLNVAAAKIDSNLTFASWNPTVTGYSGSLTDKNGLSLTIAPITANDGTVLNMITHLSWDDEANVLRKYIEYMVEGSDSVHMTQITLDAIDITGENKLLNVFPDMVDGSNSFNYNSWPAYLTNHFMGIEFPVATTIDDGSKLYLRHVPEIDMYGGFWYTSKTEICGLADSQDSEDAFWDYMYPRTMSYKSEDKGFFFNYDTWWSQYDCPFDEARILDMMQEFFGGISKYGAYVKCFTLDLGWSSNHSNWAIDPDRFPEEFVNIEAYAETYGNGSRVGTWVSPAAAYIPVGTDIQWAKDSGFLVSTSPDRICLWDDNFAEDMEKNVYYNVKTYQLGVLRSDGMYLICNEVDHGHPGDNSEQVVRGTGAVEHAAENYIEILEAAIEGNPNIFVNSINTFGASNPSPWWMQWVNATNANFGDDSPKGRIPSPDYRDSYTSARDFFSLQGLCNFDIPAEMQDAFGLVHQTASDFTNDFVSVLFRGHNFIDLYVNDDHMSDERYKTLADMMNWAIANEDSLLGGTTPIYPESWDLVDQYPVTHSKQIWREPYGFAHQDLVMLRNPWIEETSMTVEIPSDREGGYDIISLYPEVRVYAKGVSAGQTITVPLAAYETIVLATEDSGVVDLPVYTLENAITATNVSFEYDTSVRRQVSASFSADVTVYDETNRFYLLLEANNDPKKPSITIKVDGQNKTVKYAGTETDAWSADGRSAPESWLYAYVDIPAGTHSISVEFTESDIINQIGGYILSTHTSASDVTHENMLPHPEELSGRSLVLFETDLTGESEFVIANCDNVSQVGNLMACYTDTSNKKEGTGSVMHPNSDVAAVFPISFKPSDLTSLHEDGLIHLWIYVSDATGLVDGLGRIELAHDSGADFATTYSYWDVKGLAQGWNNVILPISEMQQDNADWSKLTYFRFYQYVSKPITIGIDDVYIGHPDDMPTVYTVTFEGGIATEGNTPAPKSVTPGSSVGIPKNSFINMGYTFAGWLCSLDGKVYQPGDLYTMGEGDVNFTAQWNEGMPENFSTAIAMGNANAIGNASDTIFYFDGTGGGPLFPTAQLIDGKIGFVEQAKTGINIIQRHPINMSISELPSSYLTLTFNFYIEDASKLDAAESFFNIISGVNTGVRQAKMSDFGEIVSGWNSLSLPLSSMNATVGTLDLLDLQAISVGLYTSSDVKIGMSNVKLVYGEGVEEEEPELPSVDPTPIPENTVGLALALSGSAAADSLFQPNPNQPILFPSVSLYGGKYAYGAETQEGSSFVIQKYPLDASATVSGRLASEYTLKLQLYIEDLSVIDMENSFVRMVVGPSAVDPQGGGWDTPLSTLNLQNGWNSVEVPLTSTYYKGALDVSTVTDLNFTAFNVTLYASGVTDVAAYDAWLCY